MNQQELQDVTQPHTQLARELLMLLLIHSDPA
jgi:hypothetical protein